jgi:uncharacterized protein (TIGR03437 family)
MTYRKAIQETKVLLILVLLLAVGMTAFAQPGSLDFLKEQDSSYALFANTSATHQPGKKYPNELVLITGLPDQPAIAARVPLGHTTPRCPSPELTCGGIRSVVLSPGGDTALAASDPDDLDPSTLYILSNVRAFVRSRNAADLRIRTIHATEAPQIEELSGLAFGPDGKWAVAHSRYPIDLNYQREGGSVVVITGLPDRPVFSEPFPVPIHSQGNIQLSLDGDTLLINDTVDNSNTDLSCRPCRSNLIVVQGIRPGGPPPSIAASVSIPKPQGYPADGPPVVRFARLSLDGRFVIAPSPLIRELPAAGPPVGWNRVALLGPVWRGALGEARILTEQDGAAGGPIDAAISPDGDTALIVHNLDMGGARLLTGLSGGDPAKFQMKALPFPFFGPPFPMGSEGPPVLAPHGQAVFTANGETVLVNNWVIPPLARSPLAPSLSVLAGFRAGNVRVVTHLSDPALNPFDNPQQIAVAPSGLLDYLGLWVRDADKRGSLQALINEATGAADRSAAIDRLMRFLRAVHSFRAEGGLTRVQAEVLVLMATVGVQALSARAENASAASLLAGATAPGAIGSLFGDGFATGDVSAAAGPLPASLGGVTLQVIDSAGAERPAALYLVSPRQINYVVPVGTAAGRATLLVLSRGSVLAAATLEVDPVAPALFPVAVVQRVKAGGSQSFEPVTGPIDLGSESDQVFLVLFGTGLRGRSGAAVVRLGADAAQVTYAGAQSQFEGLDQVNVQLTQSLRGRGAMPVDLTVDGRAANRITVAFR